MAPNQPGSARRYRHRILVIGALATGALYSIGAPIFNNRIEADLERRVPAELAAAGFPGVAATFTGQDGLLRCDDPLVDPEGARSAAYDVWGVHAIDVDRSCRVNRAPVVQPPPTSEVSGSSEAAADDSSSADPSDEQRSTAPAPVVATDPPATDADDPATTGESSTTDRVTLAEVLRSDPQFSLLSVLVDEAGLTSRLDDPASDPVTLFAPRDEAFDALAADILTQVRSDPEMLARMLEHHVVAGSMIAGDLADGELTTLAGDTLDVTVAAAADGPVISIDDAMVVATDIAADNGVVHVVDQVLLPAGLDIEVETRAQAAARLDAGTVTLDGVVASEVERLALVGAATAAVGADGVVDGVVDGLDVDAERGLDAGTVADLARLVGAMTEHLDSGVAAYDGSGLVIEGIHPSDSARDAVLAVADEVDAVTDLEPRPGATADAAAELEAALAELVASEPILFELGSANPDPSTAPLFDRMADAILQVDGVRVTVEGHTDSAGLAATNQALSANRAEAVRAQLVIRGVAQESISAEGFGSQQPVLVDGVEDPVASRRVVLRVTAAA